LRRLRKFRRLGAKAKACAVEGAGSHLSRNCGGEGGAPGKGKNKVNYPTLRQRMAEGWGTRAARVREMAICHAEATIFCYLLDEIT